VDAGGGDSFLHGRQTGRHGAQLALQPIDCGGQGVWRCTRRCSCSGEGVRRSSERKLGGARRCRLRGNGQRRRGAPDGCGGRCGGAVVAGAAELAMGLAWESDTRLLGLGDMRRL
jgi:hypothetical protein